MAVSRKVREFMEQGSWIRRMFEEGIALKRQFGEDAVFDLSLAIPTEDVVSIAELNATTRSTLCGRRRAAPGASVRQDR